MGELVAFRQVSSRLHPVLRPSGCPCCPRRKLNKVSFVVKMNQGLHSTAPGTGKTLLNPAGEEEVCPEDAVGGIHALFPHRASLPPSCPHTAPPAARAQRRLLEESAQEERSRGPDTWEPSSPQGNDQTPPSELLERHQPTGPALPPAATGFLVPHS